MSYSYNHNSNIVPTIIIIRTTTTTTTIIIIIRINALFGKGGRKEKREKKENCVDMTISLVWLAL